LSCKSWSNSCSRFPLSITSLLFCSSNDCWSSCRCNCSRCNYGTKTNKIRRDQAATSQLKICHVVFQSYRTELIADCMLLPCI